jgi:hypothetical protein
MTLPLFQMLQHVIESRVHVGTQIAEARVIDKDSHKYGDCRNTGRKSDLNGCHGRSQHTLLHFSSEPRPQGAIPC